MTKYNLDIFLENLFEWVNSFRLKNKTGQFSLIRNKQKASLYGLCDIIFNLTIPNELNNYINIYSDEKVSDWVKHIQSYQIPKSGWFKDKYFNYRYRSPLTGQWEHCTAFSTAALKLLDAVPKHELRIKKKLYSKKNVERWLKKVPWWGLFYWSGSHKGGGVPAVFASLGVNYYPHKSFFKWYFDWLDKRADPEVGFWRLGWNHIVKKRLTRHELGGAVHYYWIYEFMGHPIPYPEEIIDATLMLQNKLGLWGEDVSYCIDLDAIFCLFRCCKQAASYKKELIRKAIIKYLDYTIPSLNNPNFLFNKYKSTHKLTGCLAAIAEIYKFMPELFDLPKPWIQTLDISPWI